VRTSQHFLIVWPLNIYWKDK